jgi:hypothetical protein
MSTYSAASFKRATGIHKNVFLEIVEILNNHKQLHRKHPTSGNKPILSTEDALLIVLMYYREYRTQYHIGITYGLSESRVCEIIKEIETIIVQDARYHLPGKKKRHTQKTQVIADKKTKKIICTALAKVEITTLNYLKQVKHIYTHLLKVKLILAIRAYKSCIVIQ